MSAYTPQIQWTLGGLRYALVVKLAYNHFAWCSSQLVAVDLPDPALNVGLAAAACFGAFCFAQPNVWAARRGS